MRYADIKNPRKHRLLCSLTGAPADEAGHLVHRGMGGTSLPESEQDATPLTRRIHELQHAAHITLWRGDDGLLMFRADDKGARTLRRLGVRVAEGTTHTALYEGRTYDDAPDMALEEELHL